MGKKRRQYLIRPVGERNDARGMRGERDFSSTVIHDRARLSGRRWRDRAGGEEEDCESRE